LDVQTNDEGLLLEIEEVYELHFTHFPKYSPNEWYTTFAKQSAQAIV
jgi:hypothetical protein